MTILVLSTHPALEEMGLLMRQSDSRHMAYTYYDYHVTQTIAAYENSWCITIPNDNHYVMTFCILCAHLI